MIIEDGRIAGVETDRGIIEADFVLSEADDHHIESDLLPREHGSYPEGTGGSGS